jgi:hypothetical protein
MPIPARQRASASRRFNREQVCHLDSAARCLSRNRSPKCMALGLELSAEFTPVKHHAASSSRQ